MSRFIISGTNSGCGKTTITCAILSALQQIGIKTAAFKCGPDYIDPMFHREVIGIKKTFNLDSYFSSWGFTIVIIIRSKISTFICSMAFSIISFPSGWVSIYLGFMFGKRLDFPAHGIISVFMAIDY